MKIVPGYGMDRHLIEGGPYQPTGAPFSPNGNTLIPEKNPVDFGNPLDFPSPGSGNFSGNDAATVQAINAANAEGLDSDRASKDQHMIDMSVANNCDDEPEKGGIQYGPRFMGGY